MRNLHTTFLLAIVFISTSLIAQTNLSPGELLILQTDENEQFIFMPLVQLDAGTTIYFTDQGVDNQNNFNVPDNNHESGLKYTAPLGGIAPYTVIIFNDLTSNNFSRWAGSYLDLGNNNKGIDISSTGDQLIAFQDANPNNNIPADEEPNFLYGVNLASTLTGNTCDAADNHETQIPSGLSAVTYSKGHPAGSFLALGMDDDCNDYSEYVIYDAHTFGLNFPDAATAYSIMSDPDNWIVVDRAHPNPNPSQKALPQNYIDALNALINGVLPIELTSFDATTNQHSVELSWATALELNSDYFDIERSTDGIHFESIGTIKASGNSSDIQNYKFSDNQPATGDNYYRLKANDLDASFSYSDIKLITFNRTVSTITLFPNPSVDVVNITSNMIGDKTLRLLDNTGRLIKEYYIGEGNTAFPIDVHHLPVGLYYVQITVEEDIQISKFLKY